MREIFLTIKKNTLNNFSGAWIFYTIFPKIHLIVPQFKNIAQFAPLIGLIIGIIQSYIFILFNNNLWPLLSSAIICLISGYLITGGLHLDGLMDTFDGIYAGKKKMYKAMKDSRVGAFGVQIIIIITLIQLASIIKINTLLIKVLPICLFWGRFSTIIYIDKFKYFSNNRKTISHRKYWRGLKKESAVTILLIFFITYYLLITSTSSYQLVTNLILLMGGLICSFIVPCIIGNKVGGVNGDTCGASVVITETLMLFLYAVFI